VICLDVLRAMQRDPDTVDAFLAEVGRARGQDRRFDALLDALAGDLARGAGSSPAEARRLVERMALALEAALALRHAPAAVADATCASRLAGDRGHAFGALPAGVDTSAVLDRALPQDPAVSR
jgi:putative acyl-CoA dehydrogenase